MKNYILIESKELITNRKNQVIFIFLLIFGLYFSFIDVNRFDPIEKVNKAEIAARYEDREHFLKNVKINETTHYLVRFAAEVFPQWNKLDYERLRGLQTNDLKKYAQATAEWYAFSDDIYFKKLSEDLRYNTRYYQLGNYFAHFDGHYAYKREKVKYQAFAKADYSLALSAFDERTALQTFYRLSQNILPIIVLIALLLLTSDILTKDTKHPSLVSGYPLTPFSRILGKSFLLFIGLVLIFIAFLPAFVFIGIQYGFGDFRYPIPIYLNDQLNNGEFHSISLGNYTLIFFGLLLLWGFLLNFLIMSLSLLFRNELVNIGLGLLVILLEFLYYRQGIGEFRAYEWLPSSFIKIGEIITGYHNYLYVTTKFTIRQFLLIFSPFIISGIGFSYLLSKRKGRFY
ncbi:hypothetical protein [Enterococcus sp. JM9B]|uniref:hypothetical protein n=1 Tax=Enterococcus sp. JM9B TaxID=1857216 RepID=UPI00137497B8|nr:hypothetical protein [Enterococcus sp. JM9B]KAF1301139.1 hypothetical protein BAU16_10390 [Enterococcus sp. JM9B]